MKSIRLCSKRHTKSREQRPVKRINVRAALIALFLGLAAIAPRLAEDYYIYRDPDGKLAISNKQPPPGSKIIKQQNLPEASQAQEPGKPQPNVQTEGSPKPLN